MPEDTLTAMLASNRTSIHRILHHTRQLLQQHGTSIEPVTAPAPLTELIADTHTLHQHQIGVLIIARL